MMAWLDVAIVAVILISALIGVARGFVKEAVSLITWVAAIWLAVAYSGTLAAWLPSALERATFSLGGTDFEIRNLRLGIAFMLLVIGTLIAGAIVNNLLARVTRARIVRGADRVLGLVFGIARGAAIVIILTLAAGLTVAPQADWWRASRLMPQFERGALGVLDLLPPKVAEHFSFHRAASRGTSDQVRGYGGTGARSMLRTGIQDACPGPSGGAGKASPESAAIFDGPVVINPGPKENEAKQRSHFLLCVA